MGTLFVVATPIGNLNDITERALDILKKVDFIAVEDTRQTVKLLNHFEIKKKMTSYHKFNEKTKSPFIIERLLEGENVALVSDAGTPCISDPGFELVKDARKEGIEVIGIPGASAAITALSISGLDSSNFAFIGFLPTDNRNLKQRIEMLRNNEIKTFIIYESPKRLIKLVDLLCREFPESRVFIASDLTKIHERSFSGKIDEVYNIISNDPKIEKGEYVVILEKSDILKEEVAKDSNTIEALLVDVMIKNNCSLKDAINILNSKCKELKKSQIYDASLKLKELFNY